MSRSPTLRWPGPADDAPSEPTPESFAALVRRMATSDLRVLQAVARLAPPDGPPPPWAAPIVEKILADARSAPEHANERRPPRPWEPSTRELLDCRDFATAMRAAWARASLSDREALRTVAAALGVEVPDESGRASSPK